MNHRTKKWLLVAGCLVVCAVMVGLIGNGFVKEPIMDAPLPAVDTVVGGITVEPGAAPDGENLQTSQPPAVVIKPNIQLPIGNSDARTGAVSTGTEQTIQLEVVKPVYDEETLTDPTKTPDGTPVSGPPEHMDHDHVVTPPPAGRPSGSTPGGLPGFDKVPQGGPNQVIIADDMYENGNKIGIMG